MTFRSNASVTRSRLLGAGAALLALALVLTPAGAAAKKQRVAVAKFTGPQAAKAEKAVAKVLKEEGYAVLGAGAWKAAQKKAKAKGTSDEAIAKTAKKAGVSAVVLGKVQKKGKKAVLVLTVRSGGSGDVVETVEVALKGAKIDAKASKAIASDLPPVVRRADSGAAVASKGEPKEEPRAPVEEPKAVERRVAQEEERRPPPEERRPAAEERRPTEERRPVAEERKTREPEPAEGGAKQPSITASVGASFWARRMSVSPDQSADIYNGRPVPGLRIDAELFPIAWFHQQLLGQTSP